MDTTLDGAVKAEEDFLHFLLLANVTQGSLLLQHLTKGQTNAISEIFLNLLFSQDLGEDLVRYLKPHRYVIRNIGNQKSGLNHRRSLISIHHRVVLKILTKVQNTLPIKHEA